jgi:hypothetical protein
VAAEELRVGDRLWLADGAGAWLVGVAQEEAPAGEPFTTYNFEVAEWHTYFVGEPGVWVHNQGRDCFQLLGVYHALRKHGLRPWPALRRLLTLTKANGRVLVPAMQDAMLDIYRTAVERLPGIPPVVRLEDIPSVADVNAVLRGKKGLEMRYNRRGVQYAGSLLEVHHTVPGHVLDDLLGVSRYADGLPSLLRADKVTSRDDALAWVLTRRDHTGRGFNIHKYVDEELAAIPGRRPYRDVIEVRDRLYNAYRRAGDDGVPGAYDVAEAVRAWLDDVSLGGTL